MTPSSRTRRDRVIVVIATLAVALAVGCPRSQPDESPVVASRDNTISPVPDTTPGLPPVELEEAPEPASLPPEFPLPPEIEVPRSSDVIPTEPAPPELLTPGLPTEFTEPAEVASELPDPDPHFTRGGDQWAPIFVDWPQPEVAIYLTGRQHGYIEPCGCTGLVNQKGGLNRRYSLLEELRARDWAIVPLDIGNQVRRTGRQAEIKFQATIEALKEMEFAAIAYGPEDLVLSAGELIAAAANIEGSQTSFTCANVNVLGLTRTHRIVESGGKRIGITAVMGDSLLRDLNIDEIETQSVEAGLREILADLQQADCDFLILLVHGEIEEAKALARQFDLFDVVVTSGVAGEPTHLAEAIDGSDAKLVQVGVKGMYVGVLGFYDDTDMPMRYQRVDLDARFPDVEPMLDVLASYQQQLKALGLEGLQVRPIPHPSGHTFVGTEVCADCHTEAFEVYETTPHSHGTRSIAHPTERSEIVRHFDPECLSCHVTGWDAQGYFPYRSGYLSIEETPHLQDVGCENCHGPGSAHSAAELGEIDVTEERLTALREEMVLPIEAAEQKCLQCHDLDNSPDFHAPGAFDEYWEQIEHYGLE